MNINKLNLNDFNKILIPSFFLASGLALFQKQLVILLTILLAFIFIYKYKNYLTTAVIITIYLVFTGEALTSIRDIVVPIATVILLVLFLKKFGLNFREYLTVPKKVSLFVGFLLLTVILSAGINNLNIVSILAIIRLIVFLLICYALYSFIDGKKVIYNYFIAFIIANIVASISIYIDIINAGFTIFLLSGQLARFTGLFGNPNTAGLLLIIVTSIIVLLFFLDKFKSKKYQAILSILLINNFFLFAVTNSRAAILAVFISGSFILLYFNRKLYLKILVSMAVIFLILLLIPQVQDFIDVFLRIDEVDSRSWFYNAGIDMVKDNPIFGIGPALFPHKFFTYLPSYAYHIYTAIEMGGKPNPHNFLLLFFTENGILGLISGIYLYVLLIYLGFKSISLTKIKSKEFYIISVGLTAIIIGVIFRSFFEVTGVLYYGYISLDLPFWIIIIALVYIYNRFSIKGKNARN